MGKSKVTNIDLAKRFPPSRPCTCEVCVAFCSRPGWWTVREAAAAIEAGYAYRMMLEISPEFTFGVLSPAFSGCEGKFAIQEFAKNGCNFLSNSRCELFRTGVQPLECRFCHHERLGMGPQCHAELEKDWDTVEGKLLVTKWTQKVGLNRQVLSLQYFLFKPE